MALSTVKRNKIIAEWKAGRFLTAYAISKEYKIDQKTAQKIILNMDEIEEKFKKLKSVYNVGYLYLIKAGETNNYKIGLAKSIKRRLVSIQNGNHLKLKLVSWVKVSSVKKKEKTLHTKYKDFNSLNEWFVFEEIDSLINDFKYFRENTVLEQVYG